MERERVLCVFRNNFSLSNKTEKTPRDGARVREMPHPRTHTRSLRAETNDAFYHAHITSGKQRTPQLLNTAYALFLSVKLSCIKYCLEWSW